MTTHSDRDYYEDLQVSRNADRDTIDRVYRLLAKRYHPDNAQTGDIEKFNTLMEAYRVLSDPERRAAFDAAYENGQQSWWKTLSAQPAFSGLEEAQKMRFGLLTLLYQHRKQNPADPGIGIWQFEKLLDCTEALIEFDIWYLKEKGWIQRMESGKLAITAEGCDIVEQNPIIPTQARKMLPDAHNNPDVLN